jgi:hypothetical protein
MAKDDECKGWTKATLYTHFDALIKGNHRQYQQQFVDSEKAVTAARIAADKATDKAEQAQEKRNEGMNEFRGQLKDQSAGFVTRTELYLALATITAIISAVSAWIHK